MREDETEGRQPFGQMTVPSRPSNGPFASLPRPDGTTIGESAVVSALGRSRDCAAGCESGLQVVRSRCIRAGSSARVAPDPRGISAATSNHCLELALTADCDARECELLRDIGFEDDDPPPAYLKSAVSIFVAQRGLRRRCFAAAVRSDVEPRQRRRILGAWSELGERLIRCAERLDGAVDRLRRSDAEARKVDAERDRDPKGHDSTRCSRASTRHVSLDLETRKAIVASLLAWPTVYQAGDVAAATLELLRPPSEAPTTAAAATRYIPP